MNQAATVPLLHRFLGIGMVMLTAALLVLRYLGIGPLLRDSVTQVIAYTLSGVALVLAVIAVVVFKPRVPDRTPRHSVAQFWSTPAVATKVLPVWFLLEGAGTMDADRTRSRRLNIALQPTARAVCSH